MSDPLYSGLYNVFSWVDKYGDEHDVESPITKLFVCDNVEEDLWEYAEEVMEWRFLNDNHFRKWPTLKLPDAEKYQDIFTMTKGGIFVPYEIQDEGVAFVCKDYRGFPYAFYWNQDDALDFNGPADVAINYCAKKYGCANGRGLDG